MPEAAAVPGGIVGRALDHGAALADVAANADRRDGVRVAGIEVLAEALRLALEDAILEAAPEVAFLATPNETSAFDGWSGTSR